MPKLSIITPTFNRAYLLEETIESILKQTFEDFEYLIVDDGSNDNTKEVVQEYLNDERVRYYYHENIGEPKTVNRGYHLSSGKYTIIINSDDPLYDKNYFKVAMEELEKDPYILAVYPNWIKIDENSNETGKVYDKQHTLLTMLKESLMIGPGMIIKKEALEKIGYRDESIQYTGDLSISFALAQMGIIKHLDIFGATHRYHRGCLQNTANQAEIGKELCELILKIFKNNKDAIPDEILKDKKEILHNALHIWKAYTSKKWVLET